MGLEIRRAPFEGKVVHPIIYRCFKKHLRWLFGISEPSTVSLAYLYKLPMFFVAARNDQILYSRPTHLKTTICYPFTATSGWVDSSSNIGPSIYYHTPSITQYSFFPSYQSFLPKKSKFSNQPCPPNHHVPQLHPTQPNQPCHSPPLPPPAEASDDHEIHMLSITTVEVPATSINPLEEDGARLRHLKVEVLTPSLGCPIWIEPPKCLGSKRGENNL